jgi:hypothetical protein
LYVKPGGKNGLCYSILPSENQDQIAKFLATDIGKRVQLRRIKNFWLRIWFDGFLHGAERKEEILKPKEIKKAEILRTSRNNNYNRIYTERLQFRGRFINIIYQKVEYSEE